MRRIPGLTRRAYTTGQIIAVEGGQLLEGTTATRKMI